MSIVCLAVGCVTHVATIAFVFSDYFLQQRFTPYRSYSKVVLTVSVALTMLGVLPGDRLLTRIATLLLILANQGI